MPKPDFNIVVAHKTETQTFYKTVGVAWKDKKRDGSEKLSIHLYMFPGVSFYAYLNTEKPESKPTPVDEETPF